MCQCGCADYSPEIQYKLRGCVVGVQLYKGCQYCTDQMAVVLEFFTPQSAWVKDYTDKNVSVTQDEDGAQLPAIPIMAVQDLRAAFKGMPDQYDPTNPDGWPTLDDYLSDFGLEILQSAVRICTDRCQKEADDRKKRTEGLSPNRTMSGPAGAANEE